MAQSASARPEVVIPGTVYYSDEIEEINGVNDIVGEKNFEEVYINYTYFEAVYDKKERVSIIREFERGELIRTETYKYGSDGRLLKKEVVPKED